MLKPLLPYPNSCPMCPVGLLPEPLKSAVLHAVKAKQVPPAVALIDAIAAAAAVVHCGFDCVTPEGDVMPATINTCVVAPSATGKGRSIKLFFAHFLDAQKRREPRVVVWDKYGKPLKIKRNPTVETMINKLSFRALLEELDGKGMNITIQREEGASFLNTDLFKKSSDSLAQLWSGEPPLDHIVHQTELIAADARGSLGFRIQPDLMRHFLEHDNRMSYRQGFWPRTIAGCHDPERFPANETYRLGYVSSTSPDAFQHRVQELAGQINIRNQSGFAGRIRIELDTNAKAFMLELGHWMSGWLSIYYADIREAAGRAWENTLRVAVVLQVFCGEESKVSRDMAERAWAIVEWSLSQHRLIFAEPGFTTTMKSVQKKQFAIPKAIRKPRPLQDAQWVLDCFGRICAGQFAQQAMVSDVCVLAGLPRKRFVAALAWLKLEGLIETDRAGQRGAVRSTASSRITAM